TPGGRALKFYSSVRLDIRRIGQLKATDGSVFGNRTKVKVVKNKVAPPFTLAEFDILYAEGISWTGSIVDAGVEYGLIEKKGSWLSCDGQQLGQGREGARKALLDDPTLADELVKKITEAAHAKRA
ncbi:MAG: hypothetical protein V2J13_11030, partial [Cycloclasticus sp.]|nr:hypothetical protein [Cycloclasticus sp.]